MSAPMSAQEHLRAAREFFKNAEEVTSHEGRVEALLAANRSGRYGYRVDEHLA